MSFTTIDDPSAHFQVLAYRGDSSSTTSADRSLTNTGNSDLQPDIVWIANRDTAVNSGMRWWDSSRGVGGDKGLSTSSSSVPGTPNDPEFGYVNTLSSDGFGVRAGANDSNGRWTVDRGEGGGDKYVAWQWKVGGGSTSSNTDGGLTTTIQTNSTAGVSIGTYTGNGGYTTIGHGLGAIPDLVIVKGIASNGGAAQYWVVGAPNLSPFGNNASKHLFLDGTAAVANNTTIWYNTAFTTTTVPIGPHAAINTDGGSYIFYAFKNIQGFSQIGEYEGSGARDYGPMIYTGFKPAFVMIRNVDNTGHWLIFDSARNPFNGDFDYLRANSTDAESNSGLSFVDPVDFFANGFRVLNYDAWANGSSTYMYIAFAESPFVTSSGIPTTAR